MNASIAYESMQSRSRTDMGTKTLWAFLALTFGLSWVPMSLFIVFADQLTSLLGEMSSHHPFFLLAVYAPDISRIKAIVQVEKEIVGLFRKERQHSLIAVVLVCHYIYVHDYI